MSFNDANQPDNGNFYGQPKPNPKYEPAVAKYNSARKLALASNFMGPFSLFFGGSLLSGAGLICALMSARKINNLILDKAELGIDLAKARKSARISIGICSVALALNLISAYILMPQMLETLQAAGMDGTVGNLGISSVQSNSTWG